ncbi:hypothetical protein DCAR_0935457 [Daucus carota subsp. sativus]|uniref:Uncharacterized protein n=1 Tax=Daucus carota subsp. sativus TaxID=79200 RepID=A0AAF0XXQ2_DAUCS|nr:hypothetical protein DCAR_0935457 [Daucus carota subsp. sativus]
MSVPVSSANLLFLSPLPRVIVQRLLVILEIGGLNL